MRSRLDKGSSYTNTLGCRSKARARRSSWRWPVDSPSATVLRSVYNLSGSDWTRDVKCTCHTWQFNVSKIFFFVLFSSFYKCSFVRPFLLFPSFVCTALKKKQPQILLWFVFRNRDKLMNTRLKTSLVIIVETFSSCLEHVLSFILTSSRALHIWASVKRDTGSRFCRTVPRNGRGFLQQKERSSVHQGSLK